MWKLIILIILVLHGLLHLFGFVKAFGWAEMNQLTQEISKPLGLVWLLAVFLMLMVGVLVIKRKQWVWIPASIMVVISQILIFVSWQDAKYGTIPNVIIFIFAIFSFAAWDFNSKIDKEVDFLLSQSKHVNSKIVNEQMLSPLPSPVKSWLNHVGIIGKEEIHSAYFEQTGQMKLRPDQKAWSPAKVEQYVTIDSPGFLWKVNMKMNSFLNVAGRDKFQHGKAALTIKIGSLIPVVNVENNEKTNQSTIQRFLMELPCFPSAALSPYIKWEEVDQNTAKATMNYQGIVGKANFFFDESGDFVKVIAMRYKDANEDSKLVECIGEAKAYRVMDGIRIPAKLNVTWQLEDGPFTWYKLEVLKAKYN